MKFYVVMMLVCLLGGVGFAQEKPEKKMAKRSLLELIAESEVVYELVEIKEPFAPTWKALAGNKHDAIIYRSAPIYAMGEAKIVSTKKYINEAKKTKVFSPGNLTLYFLNSETGMNDFFDVWDYSAEFYKQTQRGSLPDNTMKFPKYDGLRDDLIWLCRNRYFLKLMSKGKLTAEIYQFSPHEMEFLVMVSNKEDLKNLHVYAESDGQGGMLELLYGFLAYDPSHPEEFPLLDEKIVENFSATISPLIKYDLMFSRIVGSIESLKEKIKNNKYLTQRDKQLIRSVFTSNALGLTCQNELVELMKNEIIEKGDIKLLELFLMRMERRQSIADLTILAELLQTKTFLEGSPEFQELIMKQFAIRKEKEVVWILAPLMRHKDGLLYIRARGIMKKHTRKDLGMKPADWRKWYKEQNE